MYYSVVIPLYNKEPYILRAVNSVLNQTHTDFELIIIDDGSTDEGPTLVESITDPRIRVIRQPNSGVSRARNRGVKEASADWVAFLDADDEYMPKFLEVAGAFIEENKQHNITMVGANYYISSFNRTAQQSGLESGIYNYFILLRNQCSPNNSSTTIVCRDLFLKMGGFPEGVKQFEDWIGWIRMASIGSFGYIKQPLGIYHNTEGSVSRSQRPACDLFCDAKRVLDEIQQLINDQIIPPEKHGTAWRCSNEFAVNISGMLARNGHKYLALKLLAYIRLKYCLYARSGRLKFMLLHLLVPQRIKYIYRELKSKK